MTYFIKNTDTGEIVRESDTPFNKDEDVQPPAVDKAGNRLPFIQLKLVIDPTEPEHNPKVEKLVAEYIDDDENCTRTRRLVAVQLTEAELADRERQALRSKALDAINSEFADLAGGVGSIDERVGRIERFLAFHFKANI